MWERRVALLFLVSICACGASAAEVRTARQARYDADPGLVFQAMMDVANAKYGVTEYDEAEGYVLTHERWYDANGTNMGRGTEDHPAEIHDDTVVVWYEMRVGGLRDAWTVEITPMANRVVSWSAQMQGVNENDMPYWVKERVDDLYLAIYAKLKPYAKPAGEV